MGWETRARGGTYYTRSRKVRGRVMREYVGGGLAGELAATQDAETRQRRGAERAALRVDAEYHRLLDDDLTLLDGAVNSVVAGMLLLAGYRRHHRGDWRKMRGTYDQN